MKTRFCYQESVRKGTPVPCTQDMFEAALHSDQVSGLCAQIAALDKKATDFEERKGALKGQLPIIIPHSSAFANGRRISADATPSGLVMVDVDHLANPKDVYIMQVEPVVDEQRIWFVSITPSGHGLRLIAEREVGESIEDAMFRIARVCGFDEIDGVTKDLARASYLTPWEYVLRYVPEGLFEYPSAEAEEYWRAMDNMQSAMDKGSSEGCTEEQSVGCDASTYKGIPYSDIVNHLMTLVGVSDGPEPGERNTVYFSLANNIRYITDFNVELLLKVLPDFGLSIEERKQAIRSSINRPRKNPMPQIISRAIALATPMAETTEVAIPKATDLAMPRLPRLLQLICRHLPEEFRAAMVIASLPVLGTLATRVRFKYLDHQEHSFSFMSCITAPAATGKSFIRQPVNLLLRPVDEQDDIERKKEQEYKEKLRTCKNSKNQPEDPHACPRNNGLNISIAKLLQLLTYSEGKHLIGIGEEIDTLVKSERAGVWSQKSDIYRLGFDNAKYGQQYMSDNSFSANVPVYYNLLLTGTPGGMYRFFKDVEDGLVTRVAFAQLPDMFAREIPDFAPYEDKEENEIVRWARQLYVESGTIKSSVVEHSITKWLEEKRQMALETDSRPIDVFRKRCAVIGYRAGMLCYILENKSNKQLVGDFAAWVAEYTFRNHMELFGKQMEQSYEKQDSMTTRGSVVQLLSQLPEEFTTQELMTLRAHNSQSTNVGALLTRWKQAGKIKRVKEGVWRKL